METEELIKQLEETAEASRMRALFFTLYFLGLQTLGELQGSYVKGYTTIEQFEEDVEAWLRMKERFE